MVTQTEMRLSLQGPEEGLAVESEGILLKLKLRFHSLPKANAENPAGMILLPLSSSLHKTGGSN